MLLLLFVLPFAVPVAAQAKHPTAGVPRHIRVGIYQNKPKIFVDTSGKASGFFPEIIEDLATTFGWKVEYVPCDWSTCLDMAEAGKIDMMPDVAFSRQREKRFQFSHEAVLQSWSNIYSRSGHGLAALKGLAGRNVAVLRGSIQHKRLASLSREHGWNIHFQPTDTMMDALDLVLRGVAEYGIVNKFFGEAVEQRIGLERSIILFNETPLYFVFPNSFDRDLIRTIDAPMASMKANRGSVYYHAVDTWLKPPARFAIPAWVYWLIAGVGALALGGLTVTAYLRRAVAVATAALRESEQRFRDYATASADHFWEMDADLRFSRFYGSAPNQTGPAFDKQIGKTRWEVANADPDHDPGWQTHREDLLAHRPFRDFEYPIAVAGAPPQWWRVNGVPVFGAGGTFAGYRGTATEFSEQKLIEEKLQRAERLQALGQLTGGVAHDFNNILSVLVGNAELLGDIVGKNKEGLRIVDTIKKAVARGASLTNRLLAFSRKQALSPASVDITALIAGLEDMLRRSLGETIEIRIGSPSELWRALVDPRQFENALINLAVNARDAMPDGGTLTIESANVSLSQIFNQRIDDLPPGDYVQITVGDTGCGMPPEVIEKAVEPFFTTKEVGKGSGLGLSMVYGFAKQSGGHMTIESESGHGTAVRLYLPRSTAAAVHEPPGEAEPADFVRGSGRILVVEDDADVRAVAATILGNQGYQAVEAGNGEEAIARLRTEPPFDLLFTDVVLPGGMDGTELAKEAKRTSPGIKVLYATGYAQGSSLSDNASTTGALLLDKPYTRADLLRKVQSLLGRNGIH